MSIFLGKSKRLWVWQCDVCGTTGAGLTEADAARELAYHLTIAIH